MTENGLYVIYALVEVRQAEYDRAFATMIYDRAGALIVMGSAILNADRKRIIELAARHRLPRIYEWREHVEEGRLMAYGASNRVLYRGVASFVDRIFKSANPAELPVEQPTVFELAIDLKTAKALGLTLPQSVLVRADKVTSVRVHDAAENGSRSGHVPIPPRRRPRPPTPKPAKP